MLRGEGRDEKRGTTSARASLHLGGLSLLRANARARAPINVFNVIYKRLGPLSSTRTNRASIHRAHARARARAHTRHTRARALAHHASTLLLSCRLTFSSHRSPFVFHISSLSSQSQSRPSSFVIVVRLSPSHVSLSSLLPPP